MTEYGVWDTVDQEFVAYGGDKTGAGVALEQYAWELATIDGAVYDDVLARLIVRPVTEET